MTERESSSCKPGKMREVLSSWIERTRSSPVVDRFRKRHPALSEFIERRFSPHVYLGLHLTVGLLFSALFIWIFVSITDEVLEYDTLVAIDHRLTAHIDSIRFPLADKVMGFVTLLGGGHVLTPMVLGVSAVLLWARKYILAAGFLIANAGGSLLVVVLKVVIRRDRPFMEYTRFDAAGFSYPSGHAMMAVIFYGMLAYLLIRAVHMERLRVAIVCVTVFVILVIGLSRVYLGVHYISDVAAGFAGGLFWLSICITGLEVYRAKTGERTGADTGMPD